MKSFKYLLLTISFAFLSNLPLKATLSNQSRQISTPEYAGEQTVSFADPIIEKDIRQQFNIPKSEPLTRERVSQITELGLEGKKISSLEGIQYLTNLKSLSLRGSEIRDLIPLKTLNKLEKLTLWDNQIEDVSPLVKLDNLKRLDLRDNQIKNITPLTNIKLIFCNQEGVLFLPGIFTIYRLQMTNNLKYFTYFFAFSWELLNFS